MRPRQCIASITSIFMLMHTELKLPGAHNYYMFGTDVETWFSIICSRSDSICFSWRHLQINRCSLQFSCISID
jgi:hypothetical protein